MGTDVRTFRSLSGNAYQYWGVSRQRNARVWCVAIYCASADSYFFLIVFGVNNSGVLDSLPRVWSNPIRELWLNLLILTILMLTICFVSNDDKYFHARIHAEQCLLDGDYDAALKTLRRYDVSDRNISMLATYALAKKENLLNTCSIIRLWVLTQCFQW